MGDAAIGIVASIVSILRAALRAYPQTLLVSLIRRYVANGLIDLALLQNQNFRGEIRLTVQCVTNPPHIFLGSILLCQQIHVAGFFRLGRSAHFPLDNIVNTLGQIEIVAIQSLHLAQAYGQRLFGLALDAHGYQTLAHILFSQQQETLPFVFDPNRLEVFPAAAQQHHHLGGC